MKRDEAELLRKFNQLDEVNRAKVLAFMDGLIDSHKPRLKCF